MSRRPKWEIAGAGKLIIRKDGLSGVVEHHKVTAYGYLGTIYDGDHDGVKKTFQTIEAAKLWCEQWLNL